MKNISRFDNNYYEIWIFCIFFFEKHTVGKRIIVFINEHNFEQNSGEKNEWC